MSRDAVCSFVTTRSTVCNGAARNRSGLERIKPVSRGLLRERGFEKRNEHLPVQNRGFRWWRIEDRRRAGQVHDIAQTPIQRVITRGDEIAPSVRSKTDA